MAQVWDVLQESVTETADNLHRAFFSSVLGGIVTDPAFMVLHMDDHMVHRCAADPFLSCGSSAADVPLRYRVLCYTLG